MNLDLTGKHALVCGGSQGIGLAAAIELAKLGADVTLLARSPGPLDTALHTLAKPHASQQHATIAVDMADHAALGANVEAVANTRPVHILVNNTGGPPGGPAHTATIEAFLAAFNQHIVAAQTVLKAVLPGMRAANYGRIVNVISTSVKEPIKNLGVSNTIRGATASWAKTLATELGPFGITVNSVAPGFMATSPDYVRQWDEWPEAFRGNFVNTIAMRRMGEPQDVANAVTFLASDHASWITGQTIAVTGNPLV